MMRINIESLHLEGNKELVEWAKEHGINVVIEGKAEAFPEEQQITFEDLEILPNIESSIRKALGEKEVIPLRQVSFIWELNEEMVVLVHFYHHGTETDRIREYCASIMTKVSADSWERPIRIEHEVTRIDYPQPLPKDQNVVYLRKEH